MNTTIDIPDVLLDDDTKLDAQAQVLVTLIRAWLSRPESKRMVREAADTIQDELAIQLPAVAVRLPESADERRNGFARWLKYQLESLEGKMDQQVQYALASLRPQLALEGTARQVAEELVSAQLRRETRRRLRQALTSYVVRTYASRWTALNLGEVFLAGEPQRRSGIWLVPIFHRLNESWITTLRLGPTGESLSDPKALQEEIDVRLGRLNATISQS